MSIADVLSELAKSEDTDTAFIIAATINLYTETMRRKQGRALYSPADARRLLEICALFLNPPPTEELKPARGNRLDPEETAHVLAGMETSINEADPPPAFIKRH